MHEITNLTGYQTTEQLYAGHRTIVYRGIREHDQHPIVVKILRNEHPSFNEIVQFRNQYAIAKQLKSPNIITTYNLESYGNSYALIMEDFGGISLKEWVIKRKVKLSLRNFLEIAIAICDTLDTLYIHKVIHKDIKPGNVLINPETKQVKLIDFSIASLLPREAVEIQNANTLEGTLAYLSPEQTGRMNRGIDYRSDFYSLGVTFYELLTGKLPFDSTDPMELVHCHLAKNPPSVHQIEPTIPLVLSKIIGKLMAKNAEDRYQSASGIKYDLEVCLNQLQSQSQTTENIEYFTIGERDISDRFLIPEKLYGREQEVKSLLDAFDRVSQNRAEMLLIAGSSGIGKTAVVNEVHKPISRQKGYFIKGKYDQFQRNIPFSAFVQAFRDLMAQLLAESDTQLQTWKDKILEAVGENGQVLVEVIPELERIIGRQPLAPKLSGSAARNRFNLLMQKFVQVFTSAKHPLVLFLDDLQWSDAASLQLIHLLMQNSGHLLLIGAYRNNEVSKSHPFMMTIDDLVKMGTIVNTITLQSLSLDDTNQLVTDTLNCDRATAQTLTELVFQRTKGNPLFATQFLKLLHEDRLITFDLEARYWQCDIAQTRALSLTNDVVEFMALQLQKLPFETQDVLQLAACIGNQFDLATLAIVHEKSEAETADDLWKSLQEGLVIPQNEVYKFFQSEVENSDQKLPDHLGFNSRTPNPQSVSVTYKFLHDRVQQAAYSLIPKHQRPLTHYCIGQRLLQHNSKMGREDRIFELVNHLNIAIELIQNYAEREKLAQLNLLAGRKAKHATAYSVAANYCEIGRSLLASDSWQTQYELTLSLFEESIEVAYLNGEFDEMEQWSQVVVQQAQSVLDQVKVYEIKIQACAAQNAMRQAVHTTLEILERLGFVFPSEPTDADVQRSDTELQQQLQGKSVLSLLELPTLTDSRILAAIALMSSAMTSAYNAVPVVAQLLAIQQVKLLVAHGNAAVAASSYAWYGLVLAGIVGDIDRGYQFGQLALNLLEKFEAKAFETKTIFAFNVFIRHRKEHLNQTLKPLQESYQSGMAIGDFEYASRSSFQYGCHSLLAGRNLLDIETEITNYSHVMYGVKQSAILHKNEVFRWAVLRLMGQEQPPIGWSATDYSDTALLDYYLKANDRTTVFMFSISRLMVYYLLGELDRATHYAAICNDYFDSGSAFVLGSFFTFYDSLCILAAFTHQSETSNNLDSPSLIAALARVASNQERLAELASHAPMNYAHKFQLVEAERYRAIGNKAEAIECYDRAIQLAIENKFLNEEALANELAAKFYLEWDKQKIAQGYMTEAYYTYIRWGAKAKVDDLEQRYPQLLAPILQKQQQAFTTNETIIAASSHTSKASTSSTSISEAMDLTAILKASQNLSSEIELKKLLSTLLRIVTENAGADKCVLLMSKGNEWVIEGLSQIGQQERILEAISIDNSQEVPFSLINTITHTLTPSVIWDATIHPTLSDDPYIISHCPKSILCNPILNQGKLIGILYLENSLTVGAFTSDRVEVLNLICAQAAISLQNARLYADELEKSQIIQQTAIELERFQSKLMFLIERTPIGVIEWNNELKVIGWNPAAEKIFGYQASEMLNNHALEIVPEPYQDYVVNLMTDILNQKGGSYSVNENTTKDGRVIICEWINTPLLNTNGEPIGIYSMVQDITERKQLEAERQQKSDALEKALLQLQQTQIQMIQGEKMSALGNLVAGVAHEINNPVGFLGGNIRPALDYIKDIFGLLDLYQQKYPNPDREIQDEIETIDLEYIREDLPKLVSSMREGVKRIRDISNSLRTFSRADSDLPVACNIHDGIDSTIMILKHRLKGDSNRPEIQVVKEYADLPQVECFAGQLNQVFMNLLANAIDALEESNLGRSYNDIAANPNRIVVRTSIIDDKQVEIRIVDNGKGMADRVKQHVFDHLFTTKGVGKGTGLGLAIARQIISEKHRGSISVFSQLGVGTEFVISLPIQ
ncbi:MAG: hypothetical protein DCF19_23600 [Pseudanabaena frigida]|uniref:histidine kinase n=1 Tax=Pseudanabaena frigida TaxID=945775 RepID=A0A2W4XIF1_9CYAN|nr:MAG: hypothetical protein DCF19_23600 [Pseudanabaena frigida]